MNKKRNKRSRHSLTFSLHEISSGYQPLISIQGTEPVPKKEQLIQKTKSEAQALVTAEVEAAQAAWDALSDEEKAIRDRPSDVTLP